MWTKINFVDKNFGQFTNYVETFVRKNGHLDKKSGHLAKNF